MRIAVTGATGFLGEQVVIKLIAYGCDVIALGRNRSIGTRLKKHGAKFIKADLSERKSMTHAFKDCDAVVHCAAYSSPWGAWDVFHKTNVVGTKNVLMAIESSNVRRLIHVSSPSVYFDYTNRLDISENDPLPKQMVNHYAQTKLEAEREVASAFTQGLETITIRPRALFGPGDTVLFPRLIRANNRIGIPITDSAPILTDITYVENVADAIVLCLEASKHCLGNIYNISNGEPAPIEQLLKQLFTSLKTTLNKRHIPYSVAYALATLSEGIGALIGKEPPLTRYGLGVLNHSITLDISRAQGDLGYCPKITIHEGIEKFVRWWEKESANG